MRRWIYTATLLIAYVLLFGWWSLLPPRWIAEVTGPLVVAGFAAWLWAWTRGGSTRYFYGRTDVLVHGLILLDILLEAAFVAQYQHRCSDGYCPISLVSRFVVGQPLDWPGVPCALNFLTVIAAYRLYVTWRTRRRPAALPPPTAPAG